MLNASLEVRSAVVYASLIVVLVFVPVFFLEGLAGTFFRPLASAYILAILASLVVALTVTPALCLMLLHGTPERKHDAPLVRWLKAALSRACCRGSSGGPALAIVRAGRGVRGDRVRLARGWARSSCPNFQERDFLMHWVEKPGTSLDAMTRITIRASKELRAIPGVRNFGAHIGRAEVADEVVGPNFTELWISIDPKVAYQPTIAKIQEVVDGYPGLVSRPAHLPARAHQGSAHRRQRHHRGAHLRPGTGGAPRPRAGRRGGPAGTCPGVSELKVEPQTLVPQVQRAACGRRWRPTSA